MPDSTTTIACGTSVLDGEEVLLSVQLHADGRLAVAIERDDETTSRAELPTDAVAPELHRWFDARRVA